MKLSVVIPAFNEQQRLPITLKEIRPYLDDKNMEYEVLVVDDGSADDTVKICRELEKKWPQLRCLYDDGHHGKGACVKRGCLVAKGEDVLVMDADHPTPIDTYDWMLPYRENHEVVVGVRTFCGEEGASGKFRRIVGLAQQLIAHIIVFQRSVADSQCGFKLFSNKSAHQIFSRSNIKGGMYDVELFFIAHKHNIPIYSLPVKWVNKEGSTINILKCVLFDPFSLIVIRFNNLMGKYS